MCNTCESRLNAIAASSFRQEVEEFALALISYLVKCLDVSFLLSFLLHTATLNADKNSVVAGPENEPQQPAPAVEGTSSSDPAPPSPPRKRSFTITPAKKPKPQEPPSYLQLPQQPPAMV